MARSRHLPGLLVLLVLAIASLIVSRGGLSWGTGPPAAGPSGRDGRPPVSDVPQAGRSPVYPDVNIEGLRGTRVGPSSTGRNPFSLDGPAVTPVAPAGAAAVSPNPAADATAPLASPPLAGGAPQRLKFIGVVDLPRNGGRLAILSDGDFVYHGRQGDIVEGRYRILSIDQESVELERTDGRGTQVLPLSGA